MTDSLFMFLGEGVADTLTSYRKGARHALMLFARSADIGAAKLKAVAGAKDRGWEFIEVKREKEVGPDPSTIKDDILRAAAEDAHRNGHSIVVYKDELPLNS